MFGTKINIAVAVAVFAFVASIIETETATIVAESRINVTFCGPNCSDDKERSEESIVERFFCHRLNNKLRRMLTMIKIQAAPEFASCIMMYNTENCSGVPMIVNGSATINLTTSDENINFLKRNVSSYEFCSFNKLRNQETKLPISEIQDSTQNP